MDCPKRATPLPMASKTEPFFTAEITPIGTAKSKVAPIDTTASCSDAGKCSGTNSMAVRSCHLREGPNSPREAFFTKVK